jgi:hypothetical protein
MKKHPLDSENMTMSVGFEIRRSVLCMVCLAVVFLMLQACRTEPENSSRSNATGSGNSSQGGQEDAHEGKMEHLPPPSSGVTLHAIELLRHPDDHVGKMIGLDGWSMSTPPYYGFVYYRRWPKNAAILGRYTGLQFRRMIADDTCLFDVFEDNEQGDFLQGTDRQFAGQIAVKMSSPGRIPDVFQIWDVEPLGTAEGTTEAGLVIRIPMIRFWHYQDSGLDAEEPKRIMMPPQTYGRPEEPRVKQFDRLTHGNSFPLPTQRTSGGYKAVGPTASAIENMTYSLGIGQYSRSIKFVDGQARLDTDVYAIDKSSIVFGDLSGNGQPAAALVMDNSGSGSGIFKSLIAVWNENGTLKNSKEKNLGDRIVVKSIAIKNRVVIVNMLTQGPFDGMCCPTQRKILRLALEENRFVDIR